MYCRSLVADSVPDYNWTLAVVHVNKISDEKRFAAGLESFFKSPDGQSLPDFAMYGREAKEYAIIMRGDKLQAYRRLTQFFGSPQVSNRLGEGMILEGLVGVSEYDSPDKIPAEMFGEAYESSVLFQIDNTKQTVQIPKMYVGKPALQSNVA